MSVLKVEGIAPVQRKYMVRVHGEIYYGQFSTDNEPPSSSGQDLDAGARAPIFPGVMRLPQWDCLVFSQLIQPCGPDSVALAFDHFRRYPSHDGILTLQPSLFCTDVILPAG